MPKPGQAKFLRDYELPLTDKYQFSHLLRMGMQLLDWTVEDAAKQFGVSERSITRWCDGQHFPSKKKQEEIRIFLIEAVRKVA